MRRSPVILLVALAALVAAGCGEHKIKPPPDTGGAAPAAPAASTSVAAAPAPAPVPAATLLVTEDFGRTTRLAHAVAPEQSVLDALRSVADVQTSYGGRYVQAIDGLEGSLERARDWLFFVNGVEAGVSAAEASVFEGARVWWDFRRWSGYLHVPVVVGAWPEPFLHGEDGSAPQVAADPPLDEALRAAGGRVGAADADFRVLVGADADLRRRDGAWRRAAAHPRREGLTVWLDGGAVRVWDAAAGRAVTVRQARAIAVAVRARVDPPAGVVMVVAGLDEGAATAAAERIAQDPSVLTGRYAVAFGADGAPVAAGGLGGGAP